MEKAKRSKSNYSISKTEFILLEKVKNEKLIVFSPQELMRLLSWKKQRAYNILQQLKNKNIIVNVKRNSYATAETIDEHIFQIAVECINPSYISFWTALSYYGFTEQQPKAIQLVTPKQYKAITLGKYKIIPTRFKKERFFGYKKINLFTIAEKEKCILDSLAHPEKAGGFHEATACLKNAWSGLNKQIFLNYLGKFGNITLNARLGYILEALKLKQIKVTLPNTYIKLNNEKPITQARNNKWRIIVNDNLNEAEIV
jgi:predicted transcriptional regulator of viral defense system